jgi:hypothetical protein
MESDTKEGRGARAPPKQQTPKQQSELIWESSSSSPSSGDGCTSTSSTGWFSQAAGFYGATSESDRFVGAELLRANERPCKRPKFQREQRDAEVQRAPKSTGIQMGPKVVKLQTERDSAGSQMDLQRAERKMQKGP